MRGPRATALLAVGLAVSALLLAVHSLRADPELVGQAWPATSLLTALLMIAPPRQARALAVVVAIVVMAACSIAGRSLVFSVGFALANAVEALLVVRWLTGFDRDRPQLRTWVDYRRWLLGISTASLAAGAITALTLGLGGTHELWRPLLWVAVIHVGAHSVILPLFMRQAQNKLPISVLEATSHVALLSGGAFACLKADESEQVAFLLLPLMMWAAARFTAHWANLELLAVAIWMAALTTLDRGPFTDVTSESSALAIAASSQTFVTVGAITAVAFSVAMGHLRDSQRQIRENEVQLGQLLDSASGTACIATDLDGLITWFSPGAEQLLGYTVEEVVGQMTPLPFHENRELLARAQELGIAPGYQVVTRAASTAPTRTPATGPTYAGTAAC